MVGGRDRGVRSARGLQMDPIVVEFGEVERGEEDLMGLIVRGVAEREVGDPRRGEREESMGMRNRTWNIRETAVIVNDILFLGMRVESTYERFGKCCTKDAVKHAASIGSEY